MTKLTYQQYLDLRYGKKYAQHPLMPRSVSAIVSDAAYITSRRAAEYESRKAALGLDFDWTDRVGPYGGYVSALTLDADEVRALGFDPEHLTAKLTLAHDDFFDTAADTLDNAGYDFDKRRDGRSGYGWEHDENEDRPTHESVLVDYSGPRDRSDWRWVTLREKEQRYFFCGNAWAGMSKSVRAQVRHERLLELNASMADYAAKWCADDIKNFNIDVTVYWRGEEIGTGALGGCEVEDSRDMVNDVADFVLGNGLVGEALDEAVKWADSAVAGAQKRAAAIVESIALLPERSIAAVRESFTTAKVIKAKRA